MFEKIKSKWGFKVKLGQSRKKERNPYRKSAVLAKDLKSCWQLYVIIALPLIWLFVFQYLPMPGIQIAFKDYVAVDGIWGSEWVGFDYFIKFFNSYDFERILVNTLTISIYSLIAGFPFPIILAIALNSTLKKRYKKTVQMITYLPHFISVVVLVGMVLQFTNPYVGIINKFIEFLGFQPIDFMSKAGMFSSIYVWSGIWQSCGWGTIIYLAALSGVDMEQHESAMIDGATRFQRVVHIDFPVLVPTIVIVLILSAGGIMSVGFEKVYLMQNSLNREASEIISTFVYKIGLENSSPDFSYATAIGVFNSVINLILISMVNFIAKKANNVSLW